ncbi:MULTISPECIES: histidine phosphatase family protein [Bacillus cereus group]|uniref:histidine phosphatase family protein n=1 Tax=Bacillus cereus group TaxID=86661 RepID=UPI000BECBF98|nr:MULTISPECIES: histidine phosphatase family protein [Bacillus cereus group]MBJ8078160.1 histidine phosphatase family protein [Bacillus cereus group sp. N12]PDY87617.1 histidine phosphatase family protein [Bacillus toyonensis]
MYTYIYMVRHGESPKTEEENERTRGLTEKGKLDARRVTELLKSEGVDTFISSPYSRAVLTIEELAQFHEKEIFLYEDLKECVFSGEDKIILNKELYPLVEKMFSNPDFSLPGGESITDCQIRSIAVLKEIIKNFKGHKVVIGTHGLVMTQMMAYFDNQYGFEFLMETSKPDVYRMAFQDEQFIGIKRLWAE